MAQINIIEITAENPSLRNEILFENGKRKNMIRFAFHVFSSPFLFKPSYKKIV